LLKRLGERVGKELSIPVYLYESAATKPERTNLENIRKGQYEGLKAEIESNPERKPDFGPSKLPKAGATVIGARNPLIAFNVYLTSDDVSIAKKIAKAVRQSSGGLRYVKGLGLLVDGRAQVSMNLTNFRETPIARVVEFIRREAERYGVGIHHSELVGLIPQEALVDAAVWYTQLDQFDKAQILESGGGSAAAYAGAMGAALVAMVSGLTIGRKKYAEVEAEMQAVRVMAEKLRAEMTQAVDDDAASFEAVIGAFKLPKETDDQQKARTAAIQIATLNAANIPLHSAERSVKIMELAIKCAEHGNLNAISDALSGFAMSRASLTAAAYNVRINVHSLPDKSAGDEYLKELAELEKKADNLEANIRKVMKERGGI
jgi:glutamate formiminotransferase/formiminotetrahydrofolate cyclodeaminase